ncbi:MAG: SEC-C metal-binding domain-containing protein, partial [Thermodesulfobacteriota bacterium]
PHPTLPHKGGGGKYPNLSNVCVGLCKGACCDPWWGIIFYSIKSDGNGLINLKKEITKSLQERAERIKSNYITNENPARSLFKDPERYGVKLEGMKQTGDVEVISLRAMFAFRCLYLSPGKTCSIHPSILGTDIRPPHCAELGAPGAAAGEKGYCRIIEAAIKTQNDEKAVLSAIAIEKSASESHYNGCFSTLDEAVEAVMKEIRNKKDSQVVRVSDKALGRNDPCYCKSGKKYKKCHGS